MTHQVCTSPSTSIYRIGMNWGTAKRNRGRFGDWGALRESSVTPFPMFDSSENPPRSRDDGPNGRARHLVPGRMSKIGVVLQSRFPKISQCTRKFDS